MRKGRRVSTYYSRPRSISERPAVIDTAEVACTCTGWQTVQTCPRRPFAKAWTCRNVNASGRRKPSVCFRFFDAGKFFPVNVRDSLRNNLAYERSAPQLKSVELSYGITTVFCFDCRIYRCSYKPNPSSSNSLAPLSVRTFLCALARKY